MTRLAALVGAPFAEIVDYGERRMRAALRALPDGRWPAEDVLDSTGPRPEQQSPARIALAVAIDGDQVTFDFAGTDDQRPGTVNAVEAVTVSAVAFALRTATDPTIPANGGALRPVRVLAPSGSIVAARFPAAVGAGNVEVSQRVADVCLRALAEIAPDRVGAASQVLRDDRRRAGRPPGTRGDEWCPHEHDEHARHAGRGVRARVSHAGPARHVAPWERWRRAIRRW